MQHMPTCDLNSSANRLQTSRTVKIGCRSNGFFSVGFQSPIMQLFGRWTHSPKRINEYDPRSASSISGHRLCITGSSMSIPPCILLET